MTARGPAPESFEHILIHAVKGPLGGSIPEVIGPTAQKRVESTDELLLRMAKSGLNQLADFDPQGFDLTLGGSGQEFIPIFAHGVPQKIKAVFDVGDDCLRVPDLVFGGRQSRLV